MKVTKSFFIASKYKIFQESGPQWSETEDDLSRVTRNSALIAEKII